MKIEDAIRRYENWAKDDRIDLRIRKEHEQIAEWLKELQRLRQSADRPQGWIPCSERMPEYRKIVLISTFWGVKTGFLDSTEAYGDFWEIIENDATTALHNIYAWMPLPAPWEGEEDEF